MFIKIFYNGRVNYEGLVMTIYILSQVACFIGMAIDLTGQAMKNKKYIMVFSVLCCLFYGTSYVLLGSVLAAIANVVCLARSIAYLIMDKYKLHFKWYFIPMVLVNTTFIICAIFLWKNWLDLILVISVFMLTIAFMFKNANIIRGFLIVNNCMWLVFNVMYHSYAGIACNAAGLVITIVALIVYNRKGKKAENEDVKIEAEIQEENIIEKQKGIEKTTRIV